MHIYDIMQRVVLQEDVQIKRSVQVGGRVLWWTAPWSSFVGIRRGMPPTPQ